MSGFVRDLHDSAIADATVDVWQTVSNDLCAIQEDETYSNCRGTFTTKKDGAYSFETVLPLAHSIPHDSPVGHLLRSVNRKPMRPTHIHFRVEHAGFKTLNLYVFDRQCPYIEEDIVFGMEPSLPVFFPIGDGGTRECNP